MKLVKVNLLSADKHVTTEDRTGHAPVKFFLSPLLTFAIFLASFAIGRMTLSQESALAFAEQLDNIPIIGQMRHLMSSPDRKLAGEQDDRINILLLGMGGEGHEGPFLTDTIMVASIKPGTNKVALLSIPRDLIVPLPKFGWRKVNSANAFGELQNSGRGADFTRTILEGLLGIDIPYYVRVDFEGFKSVIDSVGGVDIYVERNFTDYTYPTRNYGIQMVSFKKGWQHMSGEESLKFARSRHGSNGEGSDFARAQRQQKVISALKDKLLSAKTFKNPSTIANTMAALQSNISTNLQLGEILRLARMAQKVEHLDITHKIIDNGPDSPLTDSNFGGAYVLVPKNDDWTGLRQIAANLFDLAKPDDSAPTPPPSADLAPLQKARVEIQNGTGKSGQARVTATTLQNAGFQIVKIGNADSFGYPESVIYDLTKGKKSAELDKLKAALNAKEGKRMPTALADTAGVDFVVIIGKNALNGG
ncbi:MAG TPA: LCP family protein [Candidatus Eisenbacteria bacterium]|nr:LCP family protein [Candidatus Eisenbacteria bacterium]